MMGIITEPPFRVVEKFPEEMLARWVRSARGRHRLTFAEIGATSRECNSVCDKKTHPENFPASETKTADEEHIKNQSENSVALGTTSQEYNSIPDINPHPENFPASETKTTDEHKNPWLGNFAASGTKIIAELGEEHMKTGFPIVYTSADSVFQVAAHEEIIPLPQLYALCESAREMLTGDFFIGRVIARPFVGKPGAFSRTENRKDFAVPPVKKTLLDALEERGQTTLGIGKIEDIFCKRGVANVNHTTNNADGISATIDALKNNFSDAIIFTNLVDFDMKYGHRNDVEGYADALEIFDRELPKIKAALRPNDLLIITADHGCDPTTPSTDHSREYVPLLAFGKNIAPQNLGTRKTFADIAATVFKIFGHGDWEIGESFL
jgi:phosphopentomutase